MMVYLRIKSINIQRLSFYTLNVHPFVVCVEVRLICEMLYCQQIKYYLFIHYC